MMLREPWRTRLLFLSFALNLVTIPMLVVPAVRERYVAHRPVLPFGPPPPGVMIERMTAVMPSEDGKRLREAMDPHMEEIEVARVHMEAARRDMVRRLSSTPLDREATKAAMEKWQGSWTVWSKAFGEAILDGAGQLSPAGRARLASHGAPPRHPPP